MNGDSSEKASRSELAFHIRRWHELEYLLHLLGGRTRSRLSGEQITAFCRRYRNLCTDLSLAATEARSESVLQYLHSLTARSHSQLYRSLAVRLPSWSRIRELLFESLPRRLYRDPCLRLAFAFFFAPFLVSLVLIWARPEFAEAILGRPLMGRLEAMYGDLGAGRDLATNAAMSSFYVWNNVTVAIQCFAMGVFLGLGSAACLLINGFFVGAVFGYMTAGPHAANFLGFVASHAPFELTGIAVAGAAGLKLGYSVVDPGGYARCVALKRSARAATPMILVAAALILAAAVIEGFWSPTPVPIALKVGLFLVSSAILFVYFVILGRRPSDEARVREGPHP